MVQYVVVLFSACAACLLSNSISNSDSSWHLSWLHARDRTSGCCRPSRTPVSVWCLAPQWAARCRWVTVANCALHARDAVDPPGRWWSLPNWCFRHWKMCEKKRLANYSMFPNFKYYLASFLNFIKLHFLSRLSS